MKNISLFIFFLNLIIQASAFSAMPKEDDIFLLTGHKPINIKLINTDDKRLPICFAPNVDPNLLGGSYSVTNQFKHFCNIPYQVVKGIDNTETYLDTRNINELPCGIFTLSYKNGGPVKYYLSHDVHIFGDEDMDVFKEKLEGGRFYNFRHKDLRNFNSIN